MYRGQRKLRITFIYLGTGAAFANFVSGLARSASEIRSIDCAFIVAAQRSLSKDLAQLGLRTLGVAGFDGFEPLSMIGNYIRARSSILSFLEIEQPDLVVTLMPHVWSPLMASAVRRRCGAYISIIHDAVAHPGDRTGRVTRWLLRDGKRADRVVVLSRAVAEALARQHVVPKEHILTLFHPDTGLPGQHLSRCRKSDRPFRLLFFGRILPYKGLPLLVEAVEILRTEGINISLGVAGAGDIRAFRNRLAALDAEVINRWISDSEASELLARYDAMACSHIEASQSGVAALSFGHCMPVIATPIGGLIEQVVPGKTGIVAENLTPHAFALAIKKLAASPELYNSISSHLADTRGERSMERFLTNLIDGALRTAS